jgi:hypothetical protein
VQLLNSNNCVVACTYTNNCGYYTFCNVCAGSYSVSVPSCIGQWTIETSACQPATATSCQTTTINFPYVPLPINYLENQVLNGKCYFSNSQYYVNAATTGTTIGQSDLYTSNYLSPTFTTAYNYCGYIPYFPELGHFGGYCEPKIYVFVAQPLLPSCQWNNSSLTNQIGVYGIVGRGCVGAAGEYTYRIQFSQPFTGPGTANCYTLTDIDLTPTPSDSQTSIWYQGAANLGNCGPCWEWNCITPNYMAIGIGQYTLKPGVTTNLYVDGHYSDACCCVTWFHIHPVVGAGP